jgi:hypothetical protein
MKQLVEANYELTKTADYRNALRTSIADANEDITHSTFVSGVRNGTLGFETMSGEPYQFVRGIRRLAFLSLVMLYVIGPALLVSLWSYREGNWWLLFGIPLSWAASGSVPLCLAHRTGYAACAFLLIGSAVACATKGFHNYWSFHFTCALWGYSLFLMAETVQREYAMQSLLGSEELFEAAIAQGRIMVVRR